ncbi:hypothetical protein ABZY03_07975 [Streptomyces klenkii]|uniref:hypothetical protein n=1 Tax=Streptomyces klenkii TaxID=1420899 RepID=UPI0033B8A58D
MSITINLKPEHIPAELCGLLETYEAAPTLSTPSTPRSATRPPASALGQRTRMTKRSDNVVKEFDMTVSHNITDAEISVVEEQIAKLRATVERLESGNASPDTLRDIDRRQARLHARVSEMRKRKAAQETARVARLTAEEPHAAELEESVQQLDRSRRKAAQAVRSAQNAMERLLAALDAHAMDVESVHGRLLELGLPLADDVALYGLGAAEKGAVRLDGEWWGPVPPDAVLTELVGCLARKRFGLGHRLALRPDGRLSTEPARALLKLVDQRRSDTEGGQATGARAGDRAA